MSWFDVICSFAINMALTSVSCETWKFTPKRAEYVSHVIKCSLRLVGRCRLVQDNLQSNCIEGICRRHVRQWQDQTDCLKHLDMSRCCRQIRVWSLGTDLSQICPRHVGFVVDMSDLSECGVSQTNLRQIRQMEFGLYGTKAEALLTHGATATVHPCMYAHIVLTHSYQIQHGSSSWAHKVCSGSIAHPNSKWQSPVGTFCSKHTKMAFTQPSRERFWSKSDFPAQANGTQQANCLHVLCSHHLTHSCQIWHNKLPHRSQGLGQSPFQAPLSCASKQGPGLIYKDSKDFPKFSISSM